MKCPYCSASLRKNAHFCNTCGQSLSPAPGLSRDLVALKITQPLEAPREPAHSTRPVAGVVRPNLPAPGPHDTAPLPGASSDFAPLPEGTLISPAGSPFSYQITELRSPSQALNVYRVETWQPMRLCTNPDCSAPKNQAGELYCAACGRALPEPINLFYLLKESSDVKFAPLAYLWERGLKHPGLLLFDYFQDTPYGTSPRHYLLEPEPGPTLLAGLARPQEIPRVLDWGQQLAEALAYLHANQITWQLLTGHHVAIEDKRARWVNFNTRVVPAENDPQAAYYYRQDVQALAQLLLSLCTGQEAYPPSQPLPAPVGRLFEQALGAQPVLTTATTLAQALQAVLAEMRRPASIRLISSAQTDVGSVRDLNEDSLLTEELTLSNRGLNQPLGLYAVADGMGGHSAGEVASGLTIKTIAHKMAGEVLLAQTGPAQPDPAFDPSAWLSEAIAAANTAVFEQRRQVGSDMGTTLVVALVVGDTAHIGHVGDSRAYRVNDSGIERLTADHSLVERLVATGQVSPDEARYHPQRNVIYRTIGDKARVEADVAAHRLSPGDSLLLCSDGLSGLAPDEEIWRIVLDSASPAEACRRLIAAANTAGGDDNISVIVVQVAM